MEEDKKEKEKVPSNGGSKDTTDEDWGEEYTKRLIEQTIKKEKLGKKRRINFVNPNQKKS